MTVFSSKYIPQIIFYFIFLQNKVIAERKCKKINYKQYNEMVICLLLKRSERLQSVWMIEAGQVPPDLLRGSLEFSASTGKLIETQLP